MKRFEIRELANHRTTTIHKIMISGKHCQLAGASWQSNHLRRDSKGITGQLITEGTRTTQDSKNWRSCIERVWMRVNVQVCLFLKPRSLPQISLPQIEQNTMLSSQVTMSFHALHYFLYLKNHAEEAGYMTQKLQHLTTVCNFSFRDSNMLNLHVGAHGLTQEVRISRMTVNFS